MRRKTPAYLRSQLYDYEQLNLKRKDIVQWEDGVRTTGKRGEYEWWYFDGKLDDGSSLVITYYTAPITATAKGFAPSVSFTLTRPDGTALKDSRKYDPAQCSFSRERCNIKIGENTFFGDLHDYQIHFETDKILADITLKGSTPPWRPETGHIQFGDKKYFAWLPSVPEGSVEAVVTADGKTERLSGTGYHDHNWGNTGMFWLMHHWYWGRARIGEYQIISSYITARKKYGYEHFPIFMLAKNGKLLGDDTAYLRYTQKDAVIDPVSKKYYHKTLIYDYDDNSRHYRITYQMENMLEQLTLQNVKNGAAQTGALLRLLFSLAGLEPGYLRFTGTATLEKLENGAVIEQVKAPALWELMYFGPNAEV